MKIWSNVTREEIEVAPGVFDQEAVRRLNWNTFFQYMDDLIEMGGYDNPDIVRDIIEDMTLFIYLDAFEIFEKRCPEETEVESFMNHPKTIAMRQRLLMVFMNAGKDAWPGVKSKLLENSPFEMPFYG